MPEGQNPEIFHKEITELEAKLAAKKQELLAAGVEVPEKTIFKQVVREHAAPSEQPSVQIGATSPVKPTAAASRTITPAEEQRLNLLIAHAFTKGLRAAVAEAKKTNNAYFIDLLHDRLADEYYTKLIAARKIKSS